MVYNAKLSQFVYSKCNMTTKTDAWKITLEPLYVYLKKTDWHWWQVGISSFFSLSLYLSLLFFFWIQTLILRIIIQIIPNWFPVYVFGLWIISSVRDWQGKKLITAHQYDNYMIGKNDAKLNFSTCYLR